MKIEKVTQPIYRVEFGEDVLNMLKTILGNIGAAEMEYIGANMDYYKTMHEFYNLLDTIK